MYFPKFWTYAKTGEVVTWGWSDVSESDALKKAQERQARVLEWLRSGREKPDRDTQYGYPDRPVREELLREFRSADNAMVGAVTRNSAGCRVLNTESLLFVDVDTPEASVGGLIGRLFGRKANDPQTKVEEESANTAREWAASNTDWKWRLYRTKAGVRLMAVHRPIAPSDPVVQRAFDAFKADRLYRRLCENQRCYRARLTPKPWRCGVKPVPARWPWRSDAAERAFREWDQGYTAECKRFATCKFIGEFGTGRIASDFKDLLDYHDEETRALTDLPLA
jgi:hypothetical protein